MKITLHALGEFRRASIFHRIDPRGPNDKKLRISENESLNKIKYAKREKYENTEKLSVPVIRFLIT